MYIQELANISLYVFWGYFKSGFLIKSPIFLTKTVSPSVTLTVSDTWTKSDNTPVNLISTFLEVSPSSYPKYISSDLTLSPLIISLNSPEGDVQPHPINWLILLLVYVILLIPDITIPVFANPTVESTEIIEDPTDTVSKLFELGVTLKVPVIVSDSS